MRKGRAGPGGGASRERPRAGLPRALVGARDCAAGACRGRPGAGRRGARPNGGGGAGAGEFGGCRSRPAPAEDSGGGSKRVALAAGCAPRWWASPEQPPSSVSGAGRRAAEGCVWRGLLLHRREAPQRPPVGGPRGETEAGSRVLYPRSRDSPGLRGLSGPPRCFLRRGGALGSGC